MTVTSSRTILAVVALLLLSAGCTPTKSHPGGPPPAGGGAPAAGEPIGQATIVVETYDYKTGAIIPPNERDYPLFVTIDVVNHEEESAIDFPQHLLVKSNPWRHTVQWPQVDEFAHAEAAVRVPHLTPGVGVACRWENTITGAVYQGSNENVAVHGDLDGKSAGMQCILTAGMLQH